MEETTITGKILIDDFTFLVLRISRDISLPLTASQLSQIVTGAETMILNEVRLAPCSHAGSRYEKEYMGKRVELCGICSRSAE